MSPPLQCAHSTFDDAGDHIESDNFSHRMKCKTHTHRRHGKTIRTNNFLEEPLCNKQNSEKRTKTLYANWYSNLLLWTSWRCLFFFFPKTDHPMVCAAVESRECGGIYHSLTKLILIVHVVTCFLLSRLSKGEEDRHEQHVQMYGFNRKGTTKVKIA